jgi:hypothetical protein
MATTPGMKRVTYGEKFNIEVDANLTPEEIQASVARFYDEVANCTYKEDDQGNITFVKATGVKG